jgi:sugar phosphate isomerase/epimerase
VAAILARNGLAAPAAHVPLQTLQRDLDGAIDAARTIGHNYLVLPWVSSWDYRTARSFEDLARLCNETGKRCRDAGLGFAYHNHAFEFRKDKGKTLYDILLEQTDEELVQFELDLYWAAKAGVDARSYLKGNPGRFPMAHVKDMDAAGNMADVGAGEIDFAALLPVAVKRGTRHFFVEHDKPENAMQTARAGYQALAAL